MRKTCDFICKEIAYLYTFFTHVHNNLYGIYKNKTSLNILSIVMYLHNDNEWDNNNIINSNINYISDKQYPV